MEHFPILNNFKIKKKFNKNNKAIFYKTYFIKLFSEFLKKFNLNFLRIIYPIKNAR